VGVLVFILVVVSGSAHAKESVTKMDDNDHHKWILERLKEAKSIKPGMSRAQLLKVFDVEAGLQAMLPTRYILKSCPEIHVEVTFDTAGKQMPAKRPVGSDVDLTILTVSKLYLDYVVVD